MIIRLQHINLQHYVLMTRRLTTGKVKPEDMSVAMQRLQHVHVVTDTQATLQELWERCFLFGPCKMFIRKSSVENRQSNSGVPREQLVQS